MNKFRLRDRQVDTLSRKKPIFYYEVYANTECVVCGDANYKCAGRLNTIDCIVYNNRLYVIPNTHKGCREIFNLNPLAYE